MSGKGVVNKNTVRRRIIIKKELYVFRIIYNKEQVNFMISHSPCSPSLNQLSNPLWTQVLNFLQQDDLHFFIQSTTKTNLAHRLLQIANTHFLFKKHIHAGDRSYYYSLFDHPDFIHLEGHHLTSLSFEYSLLAKFQTFPGKVREVASKSADTLPEQMREFVEQKLITLATDPGICLPGLKRQNVGLYANSLFQNFLVQQGEGEKEYFFLEQELENLRFYLTENDKKYYSSLQSIEKSKLRHFLEKPHQVTSANFHLFWLEENSLHNLIISFLVLIDLRLTVVHEYLSTLKDPFHKFVQLITRYSIYQSMVLSIEESFPFVFEQYSQICGSIVNEKVCLSLWKPAMKKWFKVMEQFHQQGNIIFHSLISEKINSQLAGAKYADLLIELPDPPSSLDYKDQVYEIVDNDPCDMDIMLVNYQECLIDVSVSKTDVHWCGHTEQRLDRPYEDFQSCFLEREKEYWLSLMGLIERNALTKKMLIQRMELQSRILKPRMVRKLIDLLNGCMFFCSVPCQERFSTMNQNIERVNKCAPQIYRKSQPPERQEEELWDMKVDLNQTNDSSMEEEAN